MRFRWLWVLAVICAGCATPREVAKPKPHLRVAQGADGSVSLDVVVRDLLPVRRTDPVVRLVGVTHLGTADYYRDLETLLKREPLVLFEGVGAANKRFQSGDEGRYSLQPALAKALGLRFQLQSIDYSPTNFVNSDLTIARLQEILLGQEGTKKAGGDAEGEGQASSLNDLMSVMDGTSWAGAFVRLGVAFIGASPQLQATVRLVLIETLGTMEGDMAQASGMPEEMRRLMEVLIRERNTTVIRDVERAIQRGRRSSSMRLRSLAVFYGAGHLPDLERRICGELGYRPGLDVWHTAFDVNPQRAGLGKSDMAMVRRMVREQMKAMGLGKEKAAGK